MMRQLALFLVLMLAAVPAAAECFADYKAKRDDPLRLHYGVYRVAGACSADQAARELAPRLAADGWELLNIMGLFDEGGLAERRESAGDFYLRY